MLNLILGMPNKIQQKPNSRFLLIKRSLPPLPRRRSFSSRLHGSPVVASLGGGGGAELGIIRVACLDGCGRQHEDGVEMVILVIVNMID